MICPKCGDKYEDDMPRCLWCDAPNPKYGRIEEVERKVGSVQKRNQDEINGFDFLEKSDEVDFAQRTSGFVEFKISKTELAKSAFGFFLYFGLFLFFVVALFFIEKMKPLWPVWLLGSIVFAVCFFFVSKTIFAIKWYKDRFVLKFLHGEMEFPFDKSAFVEFSSSDGEGFNVILKKGRRVIVLREKAFPEVTRMLCRIYDELNPKDLVLGENGSVYAEFKPLKRPVAMGWYIAAFLFNILIGLGNILASDSGYAAFAFLFAAIVLICAFYHLSDVFEIRWYKDKFVLCTRFGEKTLFVHHSAIIFLLAVALS